MRSALSLQPRMTSVSRPGPMAERSCSGGWRQPCAAMHGSGFLPAEACPDSVQPGQRLTSPPALTYNDACQRGVEQLGSSSGS